jgi:hypothetical protein
MKFDNGLTAEQQKVVDDKYEELMGQVKEKDINLYHKLRANELAGFITDKDYQVNDQDQLEMLL